MSVRAIPFLASLVLVTAPSTSAQSCNPLEDVALGLIAADAGGAFASLAGADDHVLSMTPDDARLAAAAGLADASVAMHVIAANMPLLAQFGLSGGEELAIDFSLLSNDLGDASSAVALGDYGRASTSVQSVSTRLEGLFGMDTQAAFPEILRSTFSSGLAGLGEASTFFAALEDMGATSELIDGVLAVHEPGSAAMLTVLEQYEPFEFPASLPTELVPLHSWYPGKWAPGAPLRRHLEYPEAQGVLDDLVTGGARTMLSQRGDQAALATLGEAATDLQASLELLGGLMTLAEYQCEGCGGCEYACDNDASCAGCTCSTIGFGTLVYNPSQIDEAKLAVELVMAIEVEVQGVTSPTTPEELREAVSEGFGDLADKFVEANGFLYGKFSNEVCWWGACWVFWYQSYCYEEASEWVKIPLGFIQENSSYRHWTQSNWDDATEALDEALEGWCKEQD